MTFLKPLEGSTNLGEQKLIVRAHDQDLLQKLGMMKNNIVKTKQKFFPSWTSDANQLSFIVSIIHTREMDTFSRFANIFTITVFVTS